MRLVVWYCFLGTPEIVLEDPVDDAGVELQLGLLWRTLSPVPRRDRIGQHLAHGVPVQAKLSGDLPNTLTLHHHRPANPQIYLYLCTSIAPSMGSAMTLMDGGGRSNLQPPIVSDYPPARGPLYLRRLQ